MFIISFLPEYTIFCQATLFPFTRDVLQSYYQQNEIYVNLVAKTLIANIGTIHLFRPFQHFSANGNSCVWNAGFRPPCGIFFPLDTVSSYGMTSPINLIRWVIPNSSREGWMCASVEILLWLGGGGEGNKRARIAFPPSLHLVAIRQSLLDARRVARWGLRASNLLFPSVSLQSVSAVVVLYRTGIPSLLEYWIYYNHRDMCQWINHAKVWTVFVKVDLPRIISKNAELKWSCCFHARLVSWILKHILLFFF